MNPLCALILALGLSFVAAPTLAASDPVFAAQKAADDLKAATTALSDAREAGDRVAALSLAVKAYEDGLKAMRESLRKAAIREQALRLEFESRRDRLSRLLGVLQTLQRVSSPLLLIHPSGPLGTARSGQVLADLEPWPRDIYCGSIGWAAPDGRSHFNVAIRTLTVEHGRAVLNVGGGVVWDSTAASEYEEALWKARFARLSPTAPS